MYQDARLLSEGFPIPGLHYCDQPYIVIAEDSAWICAMTTSAGHEGEPDQHISITRSYDQGRTWSDPIHLESPDQPENSYAVLLKTNFGRIYCFYNFNADNVREAITEDGRAFKRVDSLGQYVMRYSDDHGQTWSVDRHEVPVREFACDRENVYGGKIRYFWSVGRPLVCRNNRDVFLNLHKIGALGDGFQTQSEGTFIHSNNILDEPDVNRLQFTTLPDGDVGVRLPGGEKSAAEEHSLVELSDGSLFCTFRTKMGFVGCAYSRDRGHNWGDSQWLTYMPGGRRVKHPRAATFIWRCSNGKYLYWFHNHGGEAIRHCPGHSHNGWTYNNRNPAWLSCAVERESPAGLVLHFSEPEIALYDDDVMTRFSYPDLVELDGDFFISQTKKTIGRVNKIPPRIINALFGQFDATQVDEAGLMLHWQSDSASPDGQAATVEIGDLPFFIDREPESMMVRRCRTGVSIDMWFTLDSLEPSQLLLNNTNGFGHGWSLSTTTRGTIELTMSDGNQRCSWGCDPGLLQPVKRHHLVATVDAGPNIITFIVDGRLCDGGDAPDSREFGWAYFSPTLRTMMGGPDLQISPVVEQLRMYGRALLSSEAIAASKHPPRPALR